VIVITILKADRDAERRHYISIANTQHALERDRRKIAEAIGF
jgi:hypothetical protein